VLAVGRPGARGESDRAAGGPGAERQRAVEVDAGQHVDPDDLDQRLDLWLGAAEHDRAAVSPQSPGQKRQVDHQRGIGERQLGQVDDQVGLGSQRARQGATTAPLGAADLVAGATEDGRLVAEGYDCVKLTE